MRIEAWIDATIHDGQAIIGNEELVRQSLEYIERGKITLPRLEERRRGRRVD